MDARRTLVVTHDVRPRRACPAPLGQWTASPGERGAHNNAGASAAPLVHNTVLLFPTGTIERGTATQHASLGEGPMFYRAFLPRRTATERELGLLANSPVACGGLKPFNVSHQLGVAQLATRVASVGVTWGQSRQTGLRTMRLQRA